MPPGNSEGTLTVGSTLTGSQTVTPYTFLTFASSSGLDYSDLEATALPGSYTLDPTYGTGGWLISRSALQVQFVPEPGAALLDSFGLLALLRRRRA